MSAPLPLGVPLAVLHLFNTRSLRRVQEFPYLLTTYLARRCVADSLTGAVEAKYCTDRTVLLYCNIVTVTEGSRQSSHLDSWGLVLPGRRWVGLMRPMTALMVT